MLCVLQYTSRSPGHAFTGCFTLSAAIRFVLNDFSGAGAEERQKLLHVSVGANHVYDSSSSSNFNSMQQQASRGSLANWELGMDYRRSLQSNSVTQQTW